MAKIKTLTGLDRSITQVRKFLLRIGMKHLKVGSIPGKVDDAKIEEQDQFIKKNYSHAWTLQTKVNM